jgi:hypothetical protein
MGKMGSRVAFVLDPRRKADKQKLEQPFAIQMLVVCTLFFATQHLQLKIYPPWYMTAFSISNNNGNGIIQIV